MTHIGATFFMLLNIYTLRILMSFVFVFFFWFLMILLTTHLKLMTITRIPQWFIGFGQAFLCLEYFVEWFNYVLIHQFK